MFKKRNYYITVKKSLLNYYYLLKELLVKSTLIKSKWNIRLKIN